MIRLVLEHKDKVLSALQTLTPEMALSKELSKKANLPLSRMLELAK